LSIVTFAVSLTVSNVQAVLMLENTFCLPHLYLTLNELWRQKTRIMGLLYGEETTIVGRTMWRRCTIVTDRQTDGRTGGQIYDDYDRAMHSVAR